jgi:hypothetical protein
MLGRLFQEATSRLSKNPVGDLSFLVIGGSLGVTITVHLDESYIGKRDARYGTSR